MFVYFYTDILNNRKKMPNNKAKKQMLECLPTSDSFTRKEKYQSKSLCGDIFNLLLEVFSDMPKETLF